MHRVPTAALAHQPWSRLRASLGGPKCIAAPIPTPTPTPTQTICTVGNNYPDHDVRVRRPLQRSLHRNTYAHHLNSLCYGEQLALRNREHLYADNDLPDEDAVRRGVYCRADVDQNLPLVGYGTTEEIQGRGYDLVGLLS